MPIIYLRCRMKLDSYKPLPNLRQDEREAGRNQERRGMTRCCVGELRSTKVQLCRSHCENEPIHRDLGSQSSTVLATGKLQ